MSSPQPPPPADDAHQENAPPAEQRKNEPHPPEQPPVAGLPAGLPADLPAAPPRTESPSNLEESRHASPPRARTKSEASTYVGSYRPSDALHTRMPSETHYGLDQLEEHTAPTEAPPAYTELPGQISSETNGLGTNAIVAEDGRVNIRIDQKSRALSSIILPQIQRQLTQSLRDPAPPPPYIPEFLGGAPGQDPPPPLNLVIQVVGSRGDVQPFVALGKVLKETYGHRVRLATHPTFKDFVIENGLEFFSIGGDPAELMAFMVKNPGLMPGFDTLRSGDIGKRRKGIAEILRGTWRSCIETGNGLGVDPLKQSVEEWMGIEEQLPEQLRKPFIADAIIANPPSFGHLHCAEKLGIPLHVMFTMPWSPTQKFPHPLANIQSSNADATISNYISYIMVDVLTWQGLGDVINKFRKDSLHLDAISAIGAPAMLARLKVPFTYCWSPALIPKPEDWGHHISISGFFFLNLASNYTPDAELAAYLDAGEPPVYIGFGSIVVDDPNAMTAMIFEAVRMTGKRALVSKGWGGLGADELGKPEGVFMLGNCPHDWLFKRVSAVVHHGGAGTTAAGIAAGRPTVVVPFFGDQPFWGAMVARAGAGPDPIPYKDLTAEKLAEAITQALKPESLERAQELSNKIKEEDGCQKGAQSFHQMLNYDEMRCAVVPNKTAVWRIKRTQTKLSTTAATILAQNGEVNFSDLKLFRPREFVPDEGPLEPISGATGALMGTATSMVMGVADMPIQTLKLLQIHPDSRSRKGKARADSDLATSEDSGRLSRPQTRRSGTGPDAPTSNGSELSSIPHIQTPSGDLDRTTSGVSMASTTSDTPGTATHRSTFMTQAFSENTGGSRSSSRDRSGHRSPKHCPVSDHMGRHQSASSQGQDVRSQNGTVVDTPSFAENVETAMDTGKGLARIIGAGLKSPMDFSLNIAKGFHNVPKLYGSEVRQVDKVTDLQSGLRTAAKEFGFGLYDGITGIVTDPYKGAKKEGGIGFVKGVGRGLMNVPFRVMGGAWSVPGYAMKGLYQEMVKNKGKSVQNYIIAARIAQGYDEASSISQHEKDDIIRRWKYVKLGIKKKRTPGAEQMDTLHSLVEERKRKKNERLEKMNARFKKQEAKPGYLPDTSRSSSRSDLPLTPDEDHEDDNVEPEIRSTIPSWRKQESDRVAALRRQQIGTTPYPQRSNTEAQQSQASLEAQFAAEEEAERLELERAITASVAESSRGNLEEDKLIASAIRASIAELERVPVGTSEEDEEEALKRAMNASMEEAGRSGCSEEEQKVIEETLRKSLLETRHRRKHGSDSEWDTDDTEADEDFQRILAESKELHQIHTSLPQDESNTPLRQEQDSGFINAVNQAIGHPSIALEPPKRAPPPVPPRQAQELPTSEPPSYQSATANDEVDEDDEDEQLKLAIAQSQQSHEHTATPAAVDEDEDEDEQLKLAIAQSQQARENAAAPHVNEDDDEELKKAIAESERAELERQESLHRQKTEEDIVLEYVRKQSLLEEEHRQRMLQGRDTVGESSGSAGAGA